MEAEKTKTVGWFMILCSNGYGRCDFLCFNMIIPKVMCREAQRRHLSQRWTKTRSLPVHRWGNRIAI